MTRTQYIQSIANSAIKAVKGTNLFPSVLIAQACLESGNGNSSLSKQPYNNHFGIKASNSWTGKTVNLPTKEFVNGQYITINQYFRAYDSSVESFKDRNNLLLTASRYKIVLNAKTPQEQAKALQTAGYATAPNYATSLISIIHDNNLMQYDNKNSSIVPNLLVGITVLSGVSLAYLNFDDIKRNLRRFF